MADETKDVKRLEPVKDTIRELFVKSGNECAFPGCTHRIINQEGVFIAQVCHIEAAELGGQRFNETMSNEDRRQFSNLMLMCHEHHKITDDVTLYPVSVLQGMKQKHEAAYTVAADTIYKAIVDQSLRIEVKAAKHLKRMFDVLRNPYQAEYFVPWSAELAEMVLRLKELPQITRSILLVIVRRSEHVSPYSEVLFDEVMLSCNLRASDLRGHLQIMEKYQIARFNDDDSSRTIRLYMIDDWDFWADLKSFCEKTGHKLDEFINDFRFDLLD